MPRIVNHDLQRRELAQRSASLFASAGFAGLSMRTAASRLGVSTGTLYHYFPSKVALFRAVVQQVTESDLEGVTAAVQAMEADRPARLLTLLRFIASHCDRLAEDFRLVVEYASNEPRNQESVDTVVTELRSRYAAAVRNALEIRDEARVDVISLVINGMILRTMCGDSTADVDGCATALACMVAQDG